jgi:hypothetical protein
MRIKKEGRYKKSTYSVNLDLVEKIAEESGITNETRIIEDSMKAYLRLLKREKLLKLQGNINRKEK